jgi:hypothetical protein
VLEGHLVDKSGPDAGIECKAGRPGRQPARGAFAERRIDAGTRRIWAVCRFSLTSSSASSS